MKSKILNRLGAFWLLAFALITALFLISIIIYGFDIQSNGGRKALTSQLKNEGKTNYFYQFNDHVAFGVFADREPGEYDVILTTYTRNYIPFCYVCGYYMGDPDDDNGFGQPYMQGEMIYTIEALDEVYKGYPEGAYQTFNMTTAEFSYVMNLDDIGPDVADEKYRINREWVSTHYDEISYSSSDDEDCFIAFGAVFLGYIILIVWGIPAILFRRPKSN